MVWGGEGAGAGAVRVQVGWDGAVRCGAPKALLPNGNGQDVLHMGKCKTGGVCV